MWHILLVELLPSPHQCDTQPSTYHANVTLQLSISYHANVTHNRCFVPHQCDTQLSTYHANKTTATIHLPHHMWRHNYPAVVPRLMLTRRASTWTTPMWRSQLFRQHVLVAQQSVRVAAHSCMGWWPAPCGSGPQPGWISPACSRSCPDHTWVTDGGSRHWHVCIDRFLTCWVEMYNYSQNTLMCNNRLIIQKV